MTLTAVRDLPAGPERLRRVDLWTQLAPVSGLAGLAVIAAVLRLEGIGTWYWIDESLSIGLARHGLYEIPSLLLRDGSPPLWYLLLHGWTGLFGTSVVATHSLSLLFSLATVPVAWFVTRRLFGERTAWFVGALAAVNPFVTYFARETRMYSLVVLLGIVVGGAFIAAFVDGDRRAAWWFAATLTLLLYTHNWGLYTAVACAVALIPITLAAAPTERRELLRRAAIAFGVVGLCYLPWVPALLSQVSNTGAPWSFTPSLRNVVRELAALFRDERILVVLVLGAGVGAAPLVRRWSSRDGLALIVLAVLVAVPIVIGWGLAHVEPSWATRYLAVVVGPLMVVLGVGLARAGGAGVTALVLATILILQPFTRLGGLPLPRDAKSNARDVAATVAPRLAPGDVVLVAQPEAVPLFATELGEGFRYVSPTGPVEDPLLMD
ncbi:MAG TPA: glycosyltransferase family 39 protein, partial [Acidimicrobiia bacterium]|nr:glycosyltransferase family 39 protein [Acidimicrobiia bacterium]